MGSKKLIPNIKDGDWTSVRQSIAKLATKLGPESTPTFAELVVTAPLTVPSGGTGLTTLTDHGILLGSDTGAVTPLGVATNGQIPIGSTGADPVLVTITGTANQVNIANAAGSITLSTPQDIHTGANPQFTKLGLGIAPTPIFHVWDEESDDTVLELARWVRQREDANGGNGIGLAETFYIEDDSGSAIKAGAFEWSLPTAAAGASAQFTLLINIGGGDFREAIQTFDERISIHDVDADNQLIFNPVGCTTTNRTLTIAMNDDDRTLSLTGSATLNQNVDTTASPTFRNLNLVGTTPILVFKDSNSVGDASLGYIEWRDSNNTRLGYLGNASSSNDDLLWKNESNGGHLLLETTGGGIVSCNTDFTITGTLTLPTTNEINFRDTDISIGSTLFDGILDISADDSICMFYDNANVGDATDGQSLNIYRRAAEGDDYLQFYIDADRYAIINANQTLKIQRQGSTLLQLAANALTVNGTVAATGATLSGNLVMGNNDIRNTNVFVSEYLYHEGDGDTGILFFPDVFFFVAGNLEMIRFVEVEKGSDEVIVNKSGVDIDFRVESVGQTNALFVQGSDGKVGIRDSVPNSILDVTGDINTTEQYKVDDVQVVGNRVIDARCDDAVNSGDAVTDGIIDALRDAMIAHGLIAAA